jgi:hypothetical protein
MGVFEAIGNALKAIASVFGWAQQRDAEENTPALQGNAAAKTNDELLKKAEADAAAGDLDQIQKDDAE